MGAISSDWFPWREVTSTVFRVRWRTKRTLHSALLNSFCMAAQRGRFPDLADRDSLWRLLLRMTARKAIDHRRSETRLRRGGGVLRRNASLAGASQADSDQAIAEVIGVDPTPEFAAIMAEQHRRLAGLPE